MVLMVLLGGAALGLLSYSGDSWLQPVPPEAVPLDCRRQRAICRAQLPPALQDLPRANQVRTTTRDVLLQRIVDLAPFQATGDASSFRAELGARAPSLGARTRDQWEALLEEGFELQEVPPPRLPRADWTPYAQEAAVAWSRLDAERYGQASLALRKRHFRALERERAEAVARHRRVDWGRKAGVAGVALGVAATFLAGLSVLLWRRRRALDPFEVHLTRHHLRIREVQVPLEAFQARDVDRLVALLKAEDHFCTREDEFREALGARVRALEGSEADPRARQALASLLQRT